MKIFEQKIKSLEATVQKALTKGFELQYGHCETIKMDRKTWFGLIYGISTIVGLLIPNPFLYIYQQFYFKQFSVAQVQFFAHTQLNVKTVLFSTCTQFSSIFTHR